jgi:thiosulfate/3-mercaptopyruvate sulfurtransferase
MRRLLLGGILLGMALCLGCQLAPTKGDSRREYELADLQKKSSQRLKVTPATVLLDARSPFQYQLSHVPGSLNLQWQEATDALVKQLAFLGVAPGVPVMVIGDGIAGQGEEGRLAWTLFYLGVTDVQTVAIRHFGTQLTQQETPPPKNAEPWTPVLHGGMNLDQAHFDAELFPKGHPRPAKTFLLDVRSPKEFVAVTAANPDLTAINIDWREFLTEDGRPQFKMVRRLAEVNIHRDDRIILISNHGVRSAAAAMALLDIGFSRVAHFPAGYAGYASAWQK